MAEMLDELMLSLNRAMASKPQTNVLSATQATLQRDTAATNSINAGYSKEDIASMSKQMANLFPDPAKAEALLDSTNKILTLARQVEALSKQLNSNEQVALKTRKDILRVQEGYIKNKLKDLTLSKSSTQSDIKAYETERNRLKTLETRVKNEERLLVVLDKQIQSQKKIVDQERAIALGSGKIKFRDFLAGQMKKGGSVGETASLLKQAALVKMVGEGPYRVLQSMGKGSQEARSRRAEYEAKVREHREELRTVSSYERARDRYRQDNPNQALPHKLGGVSRAQYGTARKKITEAGIAGGPPPGGGGAAGGLAAGVIAAGAAFAKIVIAAANTFLGVATEAVKFLSQAFSGGVGGLIEGIGGIAAKGLSMLPFIGEKLGGFAGAAVSLIAQIRTWQLRQSESYAKGGQAVFGYTGQMKGSYASQFSRSGLPPEIALPWVQGLASTGVRDRVMGGKYSSGRRVTSTSYSATKSGDEFANSLGGRVRNIGYMAGRLFGNEDYARKSRLVAGVRAAAGGGVAIGSDASKKAAIEAAVAAGYVTKKTTTKTVGAGVSGGQSLLQKFMTLGANMGMSAQETTQYLTEMRDVTLDSVKAFDNMQTSFAVSQKMAKDMEVSTRVITNTIAKAAVEARYMKVDFGAVANITKTIGKQGVFEAFGLNIQKDLQAVITTASTIGKNWSPSMQAYAGMKMFKGYEKNPLGGMYAAQYGSSVAGALGKGGWAGIADVKAGTFKNEDMLMRRFQVVGELAEMAGRGATGEAQVKAQEDAFKKFFGQDISPAMTAAILPQIMKAMQSKEGAEREKAFKDLAGTMSPEKMDLLSGKSGSQLIAEQNITAVKQYQIQVVIAGLVREIAQWLRGPSWSGAMALGKKAMGLIDMGVGEIKGVTGGGSKHSGGMIRLHSGGIRGLTGEEFNYFPGGVTPFGAGSAASIQVLSRGQVNAKESSRQTSSSRNIEIHIHGNVFGSTAKHVADEIASRLG